MTIVFYVSDTHCCGHIRGEELARVINKSKTDRVIIKTNVMKSDYDLADVMVFQRQLTDAVYRKMMHAKSLGIKVIYDIDDNLLELPEELGDIASAFNDPETRENILRFLSGADLITACSMGLAVSLRKYCQTPICVLKNGICAEDWTSLSHADDGKVTIGWMGSKSHIADASLVSSALKRVMRDTDAHLKLIGWVGDKAFDWLEEFADRVIQEEWIEINSLPYAMSDIDIGIAPLLDLPFNRCKSSIKWMQYSAMGIPTVMSPMPPYTDDAEHMKNGVFALTEEEWYQNLRLLVESEQDRAVIGMNAMRDVLSKHTTKQRAKELLAVCKGMS